MYCQEKVEEICSFCCKRTGPPIERCPKSVSDHSCLPNTTTSPTRKPQKKGVIQITSSQGSKQNKSMEVAGWFYPTQRALLYLQISLSSKRSFWCIIFNILNLKGEREQKKRKRKVGKQKIYHMRIIIKLSCVKM